MGTIHISLVPSLPTFGAYSNKKCKFHSSIQLATPISVMGQRRPPCLDILYEIEGCGQSGGNEE